MKVINGNKKVKSPVADEIKTILDVPTDRRVAQKLGPSKYKYKGQIMEFKENGDLKEKSKVIDNPKLEVVKRGRPKLDKVAERMLTRNNVVDLSWKQLQKVLKDPKYDAKTKVAVALRLAEKTIPTQVDVTSGGVPLILPGDIHTKYL